jgi:hypothetical protein
MPKVGDSYIEQQKLQTGVLGEVYRGIPITEETRVSNWAFRKCRIQSLQENLKKVYLAKGIRAVLFGVHDGADIIKFAIFVQPSFLERT